MSLTRGFSLSSNRSGGVFASLAAAFVMISGLVEPDRWAAHADAKPTVLVTGANRGLGLEFARQFHAAGYRVIGTARKPEEAKELKSLAVRVEPLDVTDPKSVAALARSLRDEPLDVLINNAGISGRARRITDVDVAVVERVLRVNTLGPIRVTQALLPNLRRGDQKRIVNITSQLGSIDRNRSGGFYGYRESKAALNMFTRSLAADLKPEGFCCIVISPGWVRTDMGGSQAPLSPEESVRGMRKVIDGLGTDDSGGFFGHTGETLPW